jgi:hypothetical protein
LTEPDDLMKPDDAWRTLDAPFLPREEWHPIAGTCSRCGGRAWLGETRWWHVQGHCPSRGPEAEFLPDLPE